MTAGVFTIRALVDEMLNYATSLMLVLNVRLTSVASNGPLILPLFQADGTHCTVDNVGGHAIEITPDLITLPGCKGDYGVHIHYKVITRITFIATAFVAPGSQVSDDKLDIVGVCPSL